MRGRFQGFVVMLVALVALVIGHGVIRADVPGMAAALNVPGPPNVGDCVLSVDAPDLETPITTAVFGPCSGVVAGEVVSVRSGPPPAQEETVGSLMGTSGACWAAASRYVGFQMSDGVAALPAAYVSTSNVRWQANLQVRGQHIGADVLQKATGRDWSACLVRPEDLHVYLGSVRGALGRGAAPADYADCATTIAGDWIAPVPCSRPHDSERLGSAAVPAGSIGGEALDASCRKLAAWLLQSTDPTYGGVLQVAAVGEGLTTCEVRTRGKARLVGSLIGLADRPVPMTT